MAALHPIWKLAGWPNFNSEKNLIGLRWEMTHEITILCHFTLAPASRPSEMATRARRSGLSFGHTYDSIADRIFVELISLSLKDSEKHKFSFSFIKLQSGHKYVYLREKKMLVDLSHFNVSSEIQCSCKNNLKMVLRVQTWITEYQ